MAESFLQLFQQRKEELRRLREENPDDYANKLNQNFSSFFKRFSSFTESSPKAIDTLAVSEAVTKTAKKDLEIQKGILAQLKLLVKATEALKPKQHATVNYRKPVTAIKEKKPKAAGALNAGYDSGFDIVDDFDDLLGNKKTRGRRVPRSRGGKLGKLGKFAGKALGGLKAGAGRLLGAGMGGLALYETLKSDDTTENKAKDVSKTLGGMAGAEAGAAGGAALGATLGSVVPVLGTGIGAAAGGLIGGAAGYFGGEQITESVQNGISGIIEKSPAIGNAIGRAVAVPMSLFNEDARNALKSDFQNNIVPAFDKTIKPFKDVGGELVSTVETNTSMFKEKSKDLIDALEFSGSNIWSNVKDAATSIKDSVSRAATNVSSAYSKEGFTGAGKALAKSASNVGGELAKNVGNLVDTTSKSIGSIGSKYTEKAPAVMKRLMGDFDLTKEQAAGIVGNLGHESGGLQSDIQEKNPLVKGSRGGYGWAQWTGPRRRAFEAYAKEQGLDPASDDANYQFLAHELKTTHKGALSAVKKTSNAQDAMMEFEKKYEAAGIKHYESRGKYANKALDAFSKSEGSTDSIASTNTTPTKSNSFFTDQDKQNLQLTQAITNNQDIAPLPYTTSLPNNIQATQFPTVATNSDSTKETKTAEARMPSISTSPAANKPETQQVEVTNPIAYNPVPPASSGGSNTGSSTQPNLDEIPMIISDLGLILLQTGHI